MKFQVARSVIIAKNMFNNHLFLHQIPWIVKKVLNTRKSLTHLASIEALFEIPLAYFLVMSNKKSNAMFDMEVLIMLGAVEQSKRYILCFLRICSTQYPGCTMCPSRGMVRDLSTQDLFICFFGG